MDSILSAVPDGMGYYYGFKAGDGRQINVQPCGGMHTDMYWRAFVGGQEITSPHGPRAFITKEYAEEAAIKWMEENPE